MRRRIPCVPLDPALIGHTRTALYALRAAGLGTLANYACLMQAMYGTPDAGAAKP